MYKCFITKRTGNKKHLNKIATVTDDYHREQDPPWTDFVGATDSPGNAANWLTKHLAAGNTGRWLVTAGPPREAHGPHGWDSAGNCLKCGEGKKTASQFNSGRI